jgi:transposase
MALEIARLMREHRELILNYFRSEAALQRSHRGTEQQSQSNHEKVLRPPGFRTFRCLELALYQSLGKLPEPESNPFTNQSREAV